MPTSFLEIVELANGDITLQRSEDDSDPLVKIRFSEETRLYMMDNALEVARAMIQAGIQAAAMIAERGDAELEAEPDSISHVLH